MASERCKRNVLEEIEVYQSQVREALQCILHTIFFFRVQKTVQPIEAKCDTLDIWYSKCANRKSLDDKIDTKIKEFEANMTEAGPELMKGQLLVSFYELQEQNLSMLRTKIYFEQWAINILKDCTPVATGEDASSDMERSRQKQVVEKSLERIMLDVIQTVNQSSKHIPPSDSDFAFEIT